MSPWPPFTEETAKQKVQAAEDAWNTRYGNELSEFDEERLMRRRGASINDVPIGESDRRIFGPRPEAERRQSFPLR
jgi:nuclear transport factor 2 (NTF2) superfamily protein